MKLEESFMKQFTQARYFANERIHNVPLVEIYGMKRVLIEKHQGIISYNSNRILVKVKTGCIQISGDSLRLSKMSKEKVVVTGKISDINLPTGG